MIFKYISGNSLLQAIKRSHGIIKNNKIPIINYAVEDSVDIKVINKEFDNLYKNINNQHRVALKLSLFNFDEKLVNNILDKLINKNIQVLIDAENDKNYEKYNNLTNDLLLKYNNEKVNVIKTYQMYRKDSLENIENDLKLTQTANIKLGTKLVRGAYWNTDKTTNNLFINKYETDLNYNKGIIKLYKNNKNSINILASHNDESINIGYLLNRVASHNDESINIGYLLNRESQVFEFAHLLGMKENKFKYLVNNNQKVNVYIPYGPYRYMIPYLLRRLYENIDTIKYMFN